ncbi:MAG: DUF2029 domain-containing protein [Bacteroidetes bacterium]|nr:DUF2029 domain-containing protein [Bacteroidota bacterium]
MRNRVVGARLLGKNIPPYYFKWNSTYPETLFDPGDMCNIKNNMITSPPSFLLLMEPLAGLQYRTICYWWIVIHYIFFLLMVVPLYFLFNDPKSRIFLLCAAALLLFSDDWIVSILVGQNYFIVPAFISNLLWLQKRPSTFAYWLSGILLACMIWIRPNALVILPFFLFWRHADKKQIFYGVGVCAFCLVLLTVALKQQNLWIDFYSSCREWIKNNGNGLIVERCPAQNISEYVVDKNHAGHWFLPVHNQLGDIFNLAKAKLNVLIKPAYLFVFFLCCYLVILGISIFKPAKSFSEALFTGFIVYWISEVTAPILKMNYQSVELFVVILFLMCKLTDLRLLEKWLVISALAFMHLRFVPMHLVIADWLIMIGLLGYILRIKFDASYTAKQAV